MRGKDGTTIPPAWGLMGRTNTKDEGEAASPTGTIEARERERGARLMGEAPRFGGEDDAAPQDECLLSMEINRSRFLRLINV